MRIISGKLKGRKIDPPPRKGKNVRPTTGRTKEAIFSILTSGRFLQEGHHAFEDAIIADVCCGTGALGFEALSRGAGHVVFIDQDPDVIASLKMNAAKMGEIDTISCLRRNILELPVARQACNIVFIDPPYEKGMIPDILAQLAAKSWLADEAILVIEHSKREDCIAPEGFELIDERKYGLTKVTLLTYSGK